MLEFISTDSFDNKKILTEFMDEQSTIIEKITKKILRNEFSCDMEITYSIAVMAYQMTDFFCKIAKTGKLFFPLLAFAMAGLKKHGIDFESLQQVDMKKMKNTEMNIKPEDLN